MGYDVIVGISAAANLVVNITHFLSTLEVTANPILPDFDLETRLERSNLIPLLLPNNPNLEVSYPIPIKLVLRGPFDSKRLAGMRLTKV